MKIIEYFSVNNDCYKSNVNKVDERYTDFQKNGPQGLMLHSVGCPQNRAEVFAKNWNKANYEVAVHAVLQEDGTVYQCLPWNFRGWHAGGAANNTFVGVELTEPDCIKYVGGATFTCSNTTRAKQQVQGTYNTAVELFAYLCKKYNLDPMKDIISHAEGYKKGIASGHSDPTHLWDQLNVGYTMDGFRKDVKAAMNPVPVVKKTLYRIRKSWTDIASQKGAYYNLDSAKKTCDECGAGYFVFDEAGNVVYPTAKPVLKLGATGNDVKALQEGLEKLGYECGKIDGIFGTQTMIAVKAFQRDRKLTADGIVGTKTWAALDAGFEPYKVRVTADVLNIRSGAGTNYSIVGQIKDQGVYTIVEEKNGFGKLKSGAGWISLDYTKKV